MVEINAVAKSTGWATGASVGGNVLWTTRSKGNDPSAVLDLLTGTGRGVLFMSTGEGVLQTFVIVVGERVARGGEAVGF